MNPTIEKPDDALAIVHPKLGNATCRRDQLAEFQELGWKPKAEASEAEVKAADEAHGRGKQPAAAGRKAALVARDERAEEAAAEAAKKKGAKK